VAQGVDLALKQGRPGEVYNVSGRSLSHWEINGIVDRLLGCHIQRLSVSAWMMLAPA